MQSSCPPEEVPLHHLSSVMYIRSPLKSRPPSSFRESMIGPTPHKMAAVGGLMSTRSHGRRCSSIPRPTSKLTASKSPPCAAETNQVEGITATKDAPQTVVKPRTYSRTRQRSFVPTQNDPSSSCKVPRSQPLRLSLPMTTSQHVDGPNDLSGIRQQLPLTRYSRNSLASLDALVSPTKKVENTTTSLPLPGRLTKRKTSTSVVKMTSPVVSHRKLMGPLGPPVPRSHTMGNLMCSAGAVGGTPSPSKSASRTISTASQKSQVSAMDALAESRMTDKEIEYFNQVTREVEANRQRMKGGHRATQLPSHDSGKGPASFKTLASFTMSNCSFDQFVDGFDDLVVGDSSRKLPLQGAKLKIKSASRHSVTPPVLTPDSGVSIGYGGKKSWEINAKFVSWLVESN